MNLNQEKSPLSRLVFQIYTFYEEKSLICARICRPISQCDIVFFFSSDSNTYLHILRSDKLDKIPARV